MARALVTGASGFVGPHLVGLLQANGHEVWTTDRTEHPPRLLDTGTALPAGRHHRCDLGDEGAVRTLFEGIRPDWVFHLASQSSVAHSFEAPRETLLGNLGAACSVLEAMRHSTPKARLLVIGSAEQYGNVAESELPLRETAPFKPASPYAVSKVAQELLAMQYAQAFDLDVVPARSFNHSGVGQSDRFVLPGFAHQIARAEAGQQEPVLRVGNLDVQRDFLAVGDVVRAYLLLMERGPRGQAYNVCSGTARTVRALLDILVGHSRLPLRVEVDPGRWRPADLPALCGDSTRLREATGWTPRIPVDTMLAEVLDDWRQRVAGGATT